jgi:hypothetical protein
MDEFEEIATALDSIQGEFDAVDLSRRIDLGARVRELFKRVEDLDKTLSIALKESHFEPDRFVCGRMFEVKVTVNERRGIDAKSLREDEPAIAAHYESVTQYESLIYRAR